jgi:hypothetical protein
MTRYHVEFDVKSHNDAQWQETDNPSRNNQVKYLQVAMWDKIFVPCDAVITVLPELAPTEPGQYRSLSTDQHYMLVHFPFTGSWWYGYEGDNDVWTCLTPAMLPDDLVEVD